MVLDVNETTTCLTLDEQGSTDIALVGAKAANLARARAGGLPALPGAVLTTNWSPSDAEAAWAVYDEISRGGRSPVVVRSSSTGEDGEVSSMAGVFESVLDVTRGSFLRAVATVLSSSSRASTHDLVSAPMAVLVQPMLRPRWGGVLFSADPVTGRRDRFLVAAVPGAPDALVSGEVDGWTAVLDPRGRIREVRSAGEPDDRPPADQLRELARLAKRAEALYGRPQDLEWAIDDDLGLVLLQARPITTISDPRSPVFGPGPVAESFPEPLCRLEEDLWLEPLRRGLREALRLSGTCVPRDLETSELVIAVDGAPAVHLSCIGADEPGRATVLQRLDPRPPARRLRAAWRVGRLRAAIGQLSADVSLVVDSHLTSVEEIASLSDDQLLAVMFRSRDLLVSLHGYEVLAGLLIPDTATSSVTASSLALAAVAQGRAAGRTAREVIARDPVVLALVPPRVGPSRVEDFLERLAVPPALLPEPAEVDESALRREELKIRIRWVQELQARAAWELGTRLAAAGAIPLANQVRGLRLDELREAVQIRRLPGDLAERSEPADRVLPPRFRLSPEGRAVAVADAVTRRGRASHRDGIGAGGGVGCGVAHHSAEHAPLGAVLVVAHLDPRLAPVVPRLGGLIAETGSTLSHLAILAREYGVPVVVGCASARDRFVPGTNVLIDGHAGTVEILERHQSTPPLMEVAA